MDVDTSIKRLGDSHHALLELINKLNSYVGSEAKRLELAESVQLRLKDYENGIQSIELDIEDENEQLRRQHEVTVDRLYENLRLAKNRFRKAQIQSKKNAEVSWKQQREQLFANAKTEEDKPKRSFEERVVGKAEDITATLRRVHQMASNEVVKSHLNIEELENSTKTLSDLEERYTAVDILLAGSTRLVKHLEQADKRDRQYMIAALSFLGATVLWIIWRRLLKGPVMLIVWSLLKVLGIAKFFGRLASSSVSSAASSTAATTALVEATTDTLTQAAAETVAETIAETVVETMIEHADL